MTTGPSAAVDFSLYLISDRQQVPGGDLHSALAGALRGGVRAVQVREKDLSSRDLYGMVCSLRTLTSRYGAKLFVNDRIDIALAAGADGVHLGESSLPVRQARALVGARLMLGVSCHNLAGAVAAREGGADFITCSPIYYTPSKAPYGEPLGPARLAEICAETGIPVFALGGISRERVAEVLACGASGVALISAILAAADPERAARQMLDQLSKPC